VSLQASGATPGAPFFLEHCSNIFEFTEPVKFVKHEEGGFFASESTGEMVRSLRRWGHHSDQKMKQLQEQSKLPEWGMVLVCDSPVEYKYKDDQQKRTKKP
jgi:hypothetical protein